MIRAEHRDREAEVLLHEHERHRPRGGGERAAGDHGVEREGQQRQGERDLVELERDGALDPPAQPVGGGHDDRAPPADDAARHAADAHHRDPDEDGLHHEQRERVRPHGVDRAEQHEDGVEVVAHEVEAVALDGDERRLEARVVLRELRENAEVPRLDGEAAPLERRVEHVDGRDERRDDDGADGAGDAGSGDRRGEGGPGIRLDGSVVGGVAAAGRVVRAGHRIRVSRAAAIAAAGSPGPSAQGRRTRAREGAGRLSGARRLHRPGARARRPWRRGRRRGSSRGSAPRAPRPASRAPARATAAGPAAAP